MAKTNTNFDGEIGDLRATFILANGAACEGFDKIAAVASLALQAVQDSKVPLNREVLTNALLVIRDTAHEVGDNVDYLAETEGCNIGRNARTQGAQS